MALVSENFQNKIRKRQFCQMKQTECCLDIENGAPIHQFSWLIQIEQSAIAVCVLAGRKSFFFKIYFSDNFTEKNLISFHSPKIFVTILRDWKEGRLNENGGYKLPELV